MIDFKRVKDYGKDGGVVGGRLSTAHMAERIGSAGKDASRYWSDVNVDWEVIAETHKQQTNQCLVEIQDLKADLSGARFDAGIWRVVALCGWAVAVLAVVWRVTT